MANVAAASAATGTTGSTGPSGSTGSTGSSGAIGSTGSPVANPSISLNWAGYAVSGSPGAVRHFKHVTGSWVAPAVTCTPGSTTYSAFWVGLGGLAQPSNALEQTGTEADCDTNGVPHYSAWYELVPAGPVTVSLAITPGDAISAAVSVKGHYVTLKLIDHTSAKIFTKRLHFSHPDTTSAEWIAEAPSTCGRGGSCAALPLSDFGTVSFSGAAVRTIHSLTGSISSAHWRAVAVALDEIARSDPGARVFGPRSSVTAVPTVLQNGGSAFAVTWAQNTQSQPAGPPGGRAFPGFGT